MGCGSTLSLGPAVDLDLGWKRTGSRRRRGGPSRSGPCVWERVRAGAANRARSLVVGHQGRLPREVARYRWLGHPTGGSGRAAVRWGQSGRQDALGFRKHLLLTSRVGILGVFHPALSRHKVRKPAPEPERVDVRLWALLRSTPHPPPAGTSQKRPVFPGPWLSSLWPGPVPERTVPFLCPYGLAGVPAMLCTGAGTQPQGHCCSHIWGSDERRSGQDTQGLVLIHVSLSTLPAQVSVEAPLPWTSGSRT